MAYSNASRRFRKRTGLRPKKTIKATSTNMYKLAKQVKSLVRKERKNHQYLNFVQRSNQNVQATLTNPANIVNLCNYSDISTGQIFGSSANDIEGNRMCHKSISMTMEFDLANYGGINEEGKVQFSVFLVSLKDNIGSSFNTLTGDLQLTEGVDYVANRQGVPASSGVRGGFVMLNKKRFTIHKKKYFTLDNKETALGSPSAQHQYGTYKRFNWKVKPNMLIVNPAGDWSQIQTALDPSKQYYLLVFNDNSASDLEWPQMQVAAVHTIQTLGN